MNNLLERNPLKAIKAKEVLPDTGIIFGLEPCKYKNEAVGNVLFYDKPLEILTVQEEENGGHASVHASGKKIVFSIQNLENPDSTRQPYNRQEGYIPRGFKQLDVVTIQNNHRALIQKKSSTPGHNYQISNWTNSFYRVFEMDEIDALLLTIVNAFNERLEISKEDAKLIAENIINKLI